jgi:hypothetical protein
MYLWNKGLGGHGRSTVVSGKSRTSGGKNDSRVVMPVAV